MPDRTTLIKVPVSTRDYPEREFIHVNYDRICDVPLDKIILLLSTPRSGSTMLCEKLFNSTGALGHEYYQPHGYIQYMARRFGAIDEKSYIDPIIFNTKLIRNRSNNGLLIINLHGSHIKLFLKFLHFFPTVEIQCILLFRLNIIDQAISYALASKTNQWSSVYKSNCKLDTVLSISDNDILEKIDIINRQNLQNISFINCYKFQHIFINYENIESEYDKLCHYLNINVSKKDSSTFIKKQSCNFSTYRATSFSLNMMDGYAND